MKTLLAAASLLFIVGCASTPRGSEGGDGAIELTYVRGHNAHRFIAQREAQAVKLKNYVDRQLLREVAIATEKYGDLEEKTLELMGTLQRKPATKSAALCRTPFSLRVQGKQLQSVEGCRSSDEAAGLSKLIKEFEFTLLSDEKR